jgi:hypothetical protein
MPRADRKLTIAYIDSPECDWPATVKERAKEIIRLTAELSFEKARVSQMDMLDRHKAGALSKVGLMHQQLANAYRNLSKELVYHQSRINR